MAEISKKDRYKLRDEDFGIPSKKMYPLRDPNHPDEAHDRKQIQSAVSLFGRGNISRAEREELARRILKRARELDMDTSGWKQILAFAQEQVPPMSDGTSIGNSPPRLMAPYYDEQDELLQRVNDLDGVVDPFVFAKRIVSVIHNQVEKDSKPPTGNQNCQLCTWCAEANFRGRKVLPRPIYSPRDPALDVIGETIVMNPVRESFSSQRDVIERVRGNVDSRWYVHVNWKDSTGGHEFLVVNIKDYAYIMDAQAGILKEIDETDSTDSYFRDINFDNSYMVRLDDKPFNDKLFNKMNDISKLVPWDESLDIPYMREHGMLGDEDEKYVRDRGMVTEEDEPVQEAACVASLLTVKNQLTKVLSPADFEFIGGSMVPKFTIKSKEKPDVSFEVNVNGQNIEVTPAYKGIPDMLHKRRGIAIMRAANIIADFVQDIVNRYKPVQQESFIEEMLMIPFTDCDDSLRLSYIIESNMQQNPNNENWIKRAIQWCRDAIQFIVNTVRGWFGKNKEVKTNIDVGKLNNNTDSVIDSFKNNKPINISKLKNDLHNCRSNTYNVYHDGDDVIKKMNANISSINEILKNPSNMSQQDVQAVQQLLGEYMKALKSFNEQITEQNKGDNNIKELLLKSIQSNKTSGVNNIQVYPFLNTRTLYFDFNPILSLRPKNFTPTELKKMVDPIFTMPDRDTFVPRVNFYNGYYIIGICVHSALLASKVGYTPEKIEINKNRPNDKVRKYLDDKFGRNIHMRVGYIISAEEINKNGIPAISLDQLWEIYIKTQEKIYFTTAAGKDYTTCEAITIKSNPLTRPDMNIKQESFMDEYATKRDDYDVLEVPSDEATEYLKKDPECKQYWQRLNKETHGEVLIDTKTKDQIGHAFVYHTKKDKGFIFNINVDPKYRGKGYGKILLDDCVKKYGGYDLTVDCDNKIAVNMYLKYGFKVIKTFKNGNKEQYWMKLEKSKITQEGAGIIGKARDMTLVPVKDFKYNKVYYGDPTDGGSVRKLDSKPLFVTPYPGLASIFLGRRQIFRQLSQMGYHEVNLGYDEWGELGRCDQPLTDVHVYVKNQPDLKPFTAEYDGYLHTIDCSQLKENIFRYPWMSDPDHEVLIAKVPEVKIENVQRLHIKYHVRGIPGKVPDTPYQEGATQDIKNGVNPYSDKLVFHVSPDKHLDGQVWQPRVPEYLDPYNPDDTGFEDNTSPRICFSTSIEGALNGITVNIQRQSPDTFDKMYVYIPEKPWKEYKHKTNKELVKEKLVYDANVTREVWITEPVRMKLYGVIRVDQVSKMKRKSVVPTASGVKDKRNYYTYKWHWVVKPKVLDKATKFDYSVERVLGDLCIDIKKFRYGLIKDGRLMTGNVSDKDYDKYWVFHSGQTVDEAGGGNCYDMVEYEAGYLDAFGVPYKKYFINCTTIKGDKPVPTHTICVVPHDGKFIYIEQAFKRVVDEWGYERKKTFDKLNDVFDYVAECMADYENQDVNFGVWDYTDAKIDYGTPMKNFLDWIFNHCKMIYDGATSTKKSVTKEGYYMMDRFGNRLFTEAKDEEMLSDDMEDITIGDLNLEDDEGEEQETETKDTKSEKKDDEEPEEDDSSEPKDDGPMDEVPSYLKDRMSEEDLEDFEQPDENISARDVDLGQFGKDQSDVQNDFDPKEVTILMKLMASEADAMNEYMDGAKETNVDVLRRLYADIANEERFHMEQLLFAKCELTGEQYQPKDPEVKSEYEELLKMGMDEETAMQTAVDKCHIRGSISEDDDEERVELQADVETMEMQINMFNALYDQVITEMESGSVEDVNRAYDVFIEATYDATAASSETSALSETQRFGPLKLIRDGLRFLIKTLMMLIRKFSSFCKRLHNRSRETKRFIKNYGWEGLFDNKYRMYFVDFKDPRMINDSVKFLLSLACDTMNAALKTAGINDQVPNNLPRNPRMDIHGNVKRGIELLNGVQLIKSPMVLPKDDAERNRIAEAFFGYNEIKGTDAKSINVANSLQVVADDWIRFLEMVDERSAKLSALVNHQTSIYYTNKKQYDLAVRGLEAVTKTCKAMVAALQNDINVVMKLNNEAAAVNMKATNERDKQDMAGHGYYTTLSQNYEKNYRRVPDRFKEENK